MTPADLIAKLPPSIRIGPHDFRLEKLNCHAANVRGIWGECAIQEFTIRVQENIPRSIKAVDTLIHEINHAIWWAYKLDDEDKQERIVATMATGWTQVYRDNPWLIDWIREAIAPDHEASLLHLAAPHHAGGTGARNDVA